MKQWHKNSSLAEALHFAVRGMSVAIVREHHMRIHLLLGTLVVCTLVFLRARVQDIAMIFFVIALVIGLEMINTSLEILADALHPEYNGRIRDAKDISAGAVLFASITAGVVGLLIFLSTIQTYFL